MSLIPESFHGLQVLVVEDETLIGEEIRERLTRLGLRVLDVVDTAERAIQLAEQHRPDLLLMDIRLKGPVDGIEAADTLRHRVDAPVVFLTAHSDQETLKRAKQAEPFGYVLKPIHERDLVVAIEMALNRHRLEQRLKDSERRYAATLASVADGVIATDFTGRITFMNPVAEALTKWRLADAQGLGIDRVLSLVFETSLEARENPGLQALRLKEIVQLTEPVLLITRTGEMIPIDDSAAPIVSQEGKLLGAVVVFRDIRQRRLNQDALKQAEDQLRQAQKMEVIGRLTGGIAHDFNNLLTVINGYSEILLSGNQLDETSRQLLLEIRKAGERAVGLTRQLLAFGRKQVVQPSTIQLGQLVTDISRMLERLIGEDVLLKTVADDDLWSIRADPGQIEQVIMNLAINARDAMPQGGRLTIAMQNVDVHADSLEASTDIPLGRYVRLAVSDTGVGMDQVTQGRIFEPFFTTKDQGKGTGLGLATVYGIVKQWGGFIHLESEPGKGTMFSLYFPALAGSIAT